MTSALSDARLLAAVIDDHGYPVVALAFGVSSDDLHRFASDKLIGDRARGLIRRGMARIRRSWSRPISLRADDDERERAWWRR